MKALDSWWLDVKLGLRMLVRRPGLTLVGGIGIAMGVAISAGSFSVIYGNFLASSVPLEEGDRLVSIEMWDSAQSSPTRRILRDYLVWRHELKSLQDIGAFRTVTPNLITPGARPESVRVALMSASGFRAARVRPLMGRHLADSDEREGAPQALVISESVWRNRFGGDPAMVGRTIQLGTAPQTVVGIMPEGFAFPVNHHFWAPLRAGFATPEPLTGPEIQVFGRLAPGASLKSAQAELAAIGRRTAVAFPRIYPQLRPIAMPYAYPFLGVSGEGDAKGLHLMQGTVSLVLVLICLNVAILVYSRTAMRQDEIALRTALGAGRGRIVGQLFIESLALSGVAALAGIGIAAFALRLIQSATLQIAPQLPFWVSFQLSPGAVAYAAALSVLAAAIVGIVPALQATRRDVQSGIRGTGVRLGRTWTALIVAQVAFGIALLPGTVFNGWTAMLEGIAVPGFAAEEFLTAELGMDRASEFDRRYAARQSELIRRLQADPHVAGVTFAMVYPGEERRARIESDGAAAGVSSHEVGFGRVDAGFFQTFGVPILAGRGFESGDAAPESGAVVVNRSFAQRVFGGNALGRRIRYVETPARWYEIVGIVSDFPTGASPNENDLPLKLYHATAAGQLQPVILAIRVRGGAPETFAGHLRVIAAAVDPDLELRGIYSLDHVLRREQWIRRLEASVLLGVALSVLLLSSAGIYAMMSFAVSQRRKEIGIRTALGADRGRIVASIFSRAFGQLAIGAALGTASAVALERASEGNLLQGNAAVVVPAVAVFMIAVGILAAVGPARRALRIEPTEALRQQ